MHGILVCDNDDACMDQLVGIIRDTQADVRQVFAFGDARQALGLVKSGIALHLAFLGWELPEMGGLALAEAMRTADYNGHVVFLWPGAPQPARCQSGTVTPLAHLQKPLEPARVVDVLGHARLDNALASATGLTLHTRRAVRRVLFREIVTVEMLSARLTFFLTEDRALVVERDVPGLWSRLLAEERFAPLSGYRLVNLQHVAGIVGRSVQLDTGEAFPLPFRQADFMQRWQAYKP